MLYRNHPTPNILYKMYSCLSPSIRRNEKVKAKLLLSEF